MLLNTYNKIFVFKYPDVSKEKLSQIAKLVVKTAASRQFNIDPTTLNFETLPNGKPFLSGLPDFYFNISHSGVFLTIAFGKKPVGVDIETIRKLNLKVAERRFTDEEKAFVKDVKTFLTVWTRKEAFAKRTGNGLPSFLSSFNSLKADNVKTFEFEDYILSVCSDDVLEFEILNLKDINIKDFITWI